VQGVFDMTHTKDEALISLITELVGIVALYDMEKARRLGNRVHLALAAPVQERELAGFVIKDGIPVTAVFSEGSHAVSVDGFTWTAQPPAAPVVDCHATGVCVQSGLRAEKPAPVTLISSEQHIALREAFAINSADLYFEANPTHDNDAGRMLFERGFARGFDSHERAIETAKKGQP
jgi:hypothetical protein